MISLGELRLTEGGLPLSALPTGPGGLEKCIAWTQCPSDGSGARGVLGGVSALLAEHPLAGRTNPSGRRADHRQAMQLKRLREQLVRVGQQAHEQVGGEVDVQRRW